MQGAQSDRPGDPAQCAALLLATALVRQRGEDRVTLACRAWPPESVQRIREQVDGLIPAGDILVWHAPDPAGDSSLPPSASAEVAALIREGFLESLRPDRVLLTALMEGTGEDAVTSVGRLSPVPCAAVLQVWPDGPAQSQEVLRSCDRVFFTSAEARERAIHSGIIAAERACALAPAAPQSWEAAAVQILAELRRGRRAGGGESASRINIDRTGIFQRRPLRILVIKLDHLGDFLLSIPALSKLRARYPDAEIDAVVGSWNIPLARQLNYFRTVHAFDYFKRQSSRTPAARREELNTLLSALDHYDIAIDLRRQSDTRFLLAKLSADLKVGYECFEPETDRSLDIALPSHKDANFRVTPHNLTPIAMQMLRLVDALPADVNDFVKLPAIGEPAVRRPGCVAIFPKAGTDVREWEGGRFVELAARLAAADFVTGIRVFFVNDREAAQFTFPAGPKLSVHVGVPFTELVRMLGECHLCIANNSGGVHLASYLGLEVIGIYSGHELASEWGPQFNNSLAMHRGAHCAPCHLGRKSDCPNGNFCLADIAVGDVFAAAAGILTDDGRSGTPLMQRNEEAIVRALITAVARVPGVAGNAALTGVASAIALNHPACPLGSDSGFLRLDQVVGHQSPLVDWHGFSPAESRFRWSDGTRASMCFYLELDTVSPSTARLQLLLGTFRRQRVSATLNGVPVFDGTLRGRRLLVSMAASNLRVGRNLLEFDLPDAVRPGTRDPRKLAIAVRRFRVVGSAGEGWFSRASEQLLRWTL